MEKVIAILDAEPRLGGLPPVGKERFQVILCDHTRSEGSEHTLLFRWEQHLPSLDLNKARTYQSASEPFFKSMSLGFYSILCHLGIGHELVNFMVPRGFCILYSLNIYLIVKECDDAALPRHAGRPADERKVGHFTQLWSLTTACIPLPSRISHSSSSTSTEDLDSFAHVRTTGPFHFLFQLRNK